MENTQSRTEFFRALVSADATPEQWRLATQEDIVQARVWALNEARSGRRSVLTLWAVFAAPTAYFAYVAEPFLFIFLFLGSVFALVGAASIGQWSIKVLCPMKVDAYVCKSAMKLLANDNVAAYRDAVVAQGRELCIGDAQCMELIAKDMDVDRVCRIVHGLAQQN